MNLTTLLLVGATLAHATPFAIAARDHSAPVISSLTPNTVPVGAQGVTVVVRGSGFSSTAVVRWTGSDRPTTYVSDTVLKVQLPPTDFATGGLYQVTVYDPVRTGVVSNGSAFTVTNPQPTVTSISPTTAIAGAEPFTLTVDGKNFVKWASIRWNGQVRATTLVSSSRLTAVIPSTDLIPDTADVVVANPGPVGGLSATQSFIVTHKPPVISSLSPTQTTALSSPFKLSISGQNFVRSVTVVRWNNSNRTTTFNSPTSITADITAADIANPGTATVTVVTQVPTSTGNSIRTSPNATFTIVPAPTTATTLQAITPTSQQGTAGAPVQQPPAVRVLDQNNNPLAGLNVGFAVSSGGLVAPTHVTTDANGVARLTSWTLSQNSGVNSVTASLTALQPVPVAATLQPLTFTATAPFTLIVFVRRSDGSGLDNAQVCVGSRTDIDTYAPVKTASSSGRAIFTLAVAPEYGITSSGVGHVGQTTYVKNLTGSSSSQIMTLPAGTGGIACPGSTVQANATTITAAPADALADLDVDITQANSPIIAGTQQTYHLKAYNRGGTNASSVVLRTDLPPDLTFSSANGYNGFTCTRSGTTLTCSGATLNAADSAKIIVGMSLPLTATSGHSIQITSRIDPNNTVSESNETNNQSSAVALTQAVVKPVVDYIVTGAADVTELFEKAKAKGYQFPTTPLDNDTDGKPVGCYLVFAPAGQSWLPRVGGSGANPLNLKYYRCLYEFFKGPALPTGWELRDASWKPGFSSATSLQMGFVQRPNTTSGQPYFTTQLVFQSDLTFMEITSISLRGPAGLTWRDAFK